MLRLQPPAKTFQQLQAIAASGSSGCSRKAQAELRQRVNASLAFSVSEPAQGEKGSAQ